MAVAIVNMLDSYWCNILYSLTMGTTLKIHSACFCCWEPMELKLISSDSNELGWGVKLRGSLLRANCAYDSYNSHFNITLHSCCLTDTWIIIEKSLLHSECRYSVSCDSAYILIIADVINVMEVWRHCSFEPYLISAVSSPEGPSLINLAEVICHTQLQIAQPKIGRCFPCVHPSVLCAA